MDYKRIYDEFIIDRLTKQDFEGYSEKHHIKPRSLNGSDEADNIVKLTAPDHLFAHALLARIYKGSMLTALYLMNGKDTYICRSKRLHYEYCKSNILMTDETKKKISNSCKTLDTSHLFGNNHFGGKRHSEETKKKLSDRKIGIKFSESHKKSLSEAHSRKRITIQYDTQLIEINRFESLTLAAKSINSSSANLSK